MLIFDQTIISFIHKCEILTKDILKTLGIEAHRSRFYYQGYFYPLKIVVFEGAEWGHFEPEFYQIGLNKKLLYSAKESVLRDILKHELAHYFTYIKYGDVPSHGAEFRHICDQFGFPFHIALATLNLTEANESKVGDLEAEKVLEKVKKLLQLAQSSNPHEAELATLKANSLLLKHNLSFLEGNEEAIYLDRLLLRKRKDAKLVAIQSILKHFMVKVVQSFGKNVCCLEISGPLINVKLARYVANFLDQEFEFQWKEAQRLHQLKGKRAKNSFFLGMAKGYDQQMEKVNQGHSEQDKKALTIVKKDIEKKTQIIYTSLSSTRTQTQLDSKANQVGIKQGSALKIRKGIESSVKGLYLPFLKS